MTTREARLGAAISKAKDGINTTTEQTTVNPAKASTYDPEQFEEIKELYRQAKDKGSKSKEASVLQQKFNEYFPEIAKEIILSTPNVTAKAKKMGYKNIADLSKANRNIILNTNADGYMGPITEQFMASLSKLERPRSEDLSTPLVTAKKAGEDDEEDVVIDIKSKKRNPWIDLANQALEYLRPSDQEALDMAQLYPEMYAMSSNQLEPVPTQGYQPELGVPYDISLQDQLNANQADYRAAQRMMGYNPAAQANLNAQKYQANQGILGNQFRANQAMRDKVYSENRNILNQANLANLNIYDKQYERQAQALSNTKATTQAALNSIADKYAKNKLENRTLGVYENLYKYRYDKSGRAINMNPLFQPNISTVGSVAGTQKQVPVKDADGNILYYQLEEENNNKRKPSIAGPGIVAKSGKSIVKKNNKNSSIVKAIKNL